MWKSISLREQANREEQIATPAITHANGEKVVWFMLLAHTLKWLTSWLSKQAEDGSLTAIDRCPPSNRMTGLISLEMRRFAKRLTSYTPLARWKKVHSTCVFLAVWLKP